MTVPRYGSAVWHKLSRAERDAIAEQHAREVKERKARRRVERRAAGYAGQQGAFKMDMPHDQQTPVIPIYARDYRETLPQFNYLAHGVRISECGGRVPRRRGAP